MSALVLVGILALFGLLALLLILHKCRGGDYVKIEFMRGIFTLQYGKPAEDESPPDAPGENTEASQSPPSASSELPETRGAELPPASEVRYGHHEHGL